MLNICQAQQSTSSLQSSNFYYFLFICEFIIVSNYCIKTILFLSEFGVVYNWVNINYIILLLWVLCYETYFWI